MSSNANISGGGTARKRGRPPKEEKNMLLHDENEKIKTEMRALQIENSQLRNKLQKIGAIASTCIARQAVPEPVPLPQFGSSVDLPLPVQGKELNLEKEEDDEEEEDSVQMEKLDLSLKLRLPYA